MKEQKGGAIYTSEIQEEKTKAQKALERAKENDLDKVPVRINRMTTIFVRPDRDPIEAKARFIKKVGLNNN